MSLSPGLLELLPNTDDDLSFLDECPKRKRHRTNHQLEEIRSLRDQVSELEQYIAFLHCQNHRPLKEQSKYGRLAIQQKALVVKAMHERNQLLGMIKEQQLIKEAIEKMIFKRPRNMILKMEDTKWKALALGANMQTRRSALLSIVDRQYEMIESQMLSNGLFEPNCDVFDVKTIIHNTRLISEAARFTFLNKSIDEVVPLSIRIMHERQAMATYSNLTYKPKAHCANQILQIDACTTYIRSEFIHPNGLFKVASGIVSKVYREKNGDTSFLWRSVLEDEGIPYVSDSFINDEFGWIHFEKVDENFVRYKAYVQISSPIPPSTTNIDELSQLVQLLHIDSTEALPAKRPLGSLLATVRDSFQQMLSQFEHQLLQKSLINTI
ncbi:hypothetical protein THRCLA_02030 [Thraustotheca clavata]|uniref:Uncharacterized protein n=1 Tax=Thraustotheca clavata TaxID=74557 RepID=A0A1W0A6P5_9STRA|nr:hypothetical protein THRCLA_02030 [Thraustotheca clavata]